MEITPLEQGFINLFSKYEQNRRKLEDKWRENYNLFKRTLDEGTKKKFKKGEGEGWRCDARLGTTHQKVIQAAAILLDTALAGGEVNYTIELDPYFREFLELQGLPENYFDDAIEKMKGKIDSYFSWAHADRQMMRHALSGPIYGGTYGRLILDSHVSKTWMPIEETIVLGREELLRWTKVIREEEYPRWAWVSNWDVFTDLENPDLQKNRGTFIRWFTNKEDLTQILYDSRQENDPALLEKNLKRVIKEESEADDSSNLSNDATDSASLSPKYDSLEVTLANIPMFDFTGKLPIRAVHEFLLEDGTDEMRALFDVVYADLFDEIASSDETFNPMIEVVGVLAGNNKRVVRFAPGDPENGRAVFYAQWEESVDDIMDIGIADNCEDTQYLLDGIYRAIIDNQKLSGNVILGMKEDLLLEPVTEITPGMKVRVDPTCQDVRQALQPVVIPDVSSGLLNAFDITLRMLEDDSAVPRVQQGQEALRAETATALNQRLISSGKYFGGIVRNYDEGLTEPIVTWCYNYIMNNPDPAFLGMKGGYQIRAMGFSSFQNRVTRLNGLMQFLNIALSHEGLYRALKLESIFQELAKMLDLDPEQLAYSQEEMEAREQQEREAAAAQQELENRQKEATIRSSNALANLNDISAKAKAEDSRIKSVEKANELLNEPTVPNGETP